MEKRQDIKLIEALPKIKRRYMRLENRCNNLLPLVENIARKFSNQQQASVL